MPTVRLRLEPATVAETVAAPDVVAVNTVADTPEASVVSDDGVK
jgi:hypothetical protein